jgi:hypothetical protein
VGHAIDKATSRDMPIARDGSRIGANS